MAQDNTQDNRTRSNTAAAKMRYAIASELSSARRAIIGWGIALLVASALFALLTTNALGRFTGEPLTAYFIGLILHILLGLSSHMWKLSVFHRSKTSSLYMFFVIIFALALLVIAYFRADLLVQRGYPVLTAYLISFFLFLIEVAGPMVFGILLANSWHRSEELRRDFDWARNFATIIPDEHDPRSAWIDEGYHLRDDIRHLEAEKTEAQSQKSRAEAEGNSAEVARLTEQIAEKDVQISRLRRRYETLRRHFPWATTDFDRGVAERLNPTQTPS